MMDYLDFGGTMIVYGFLESENIEGLTASHFIAKNLKVEGFYLGTWMYQASQDKAALDAYIEEKIKPL